MIKLKYRLNEYLYYFFVKLPAILLGKFRHNLVYVHWGRGLNNFGDCLSPDILKYYGLTPVYAQQNKSDIVLAGSILQWLPKEYSGIIVGTGGDDQKYSFPYAKVLAVRGRYTLKNFDVKDREIILGDPGLLMSYIYDYKKTSEYKLGIVPHFVDSNTSLIRDWKNRFGEDVLFIDVLRNPRLVIKDILKCEVIASSSLHGLIIADSYHIPNIRFIDRNTMPTDFYDYKFKDYYSSLNCEEEYIEVSGNEAVEDIIKYTHLKPFEIIERRKRELNDLMIRVASGLKKDL